MREVRPLVEEFTLADGRSIYLLADGRLVNLSCAEGHPASVMDMCFANQALSAEYMVKNAASTRARRLPRAARRSTRGSRHSSSRRWASSIDTLTAEQEEYLSEWREGTV